MTNYLPATQNFEDIESVQEAVLSFLSFYTWAINVDQIVNKSCPVNINIIEQTPSDTYQSSGKCFTYDDSGNIITSINCNPVPIINPVSTNYSSDEINDFGKSIILSPNPTYYNCYVNWSGNILGKITQMQLTTMNGISVSTTNISNSQNSSFVNLAYQASGIYLVKFILNTGQSINKYVIKL